MNVLKLYTTVEKLEEGTHREIAEIYIGKTYILPKQDETFDDLDPTTWKMDGIKSRFQNHLGQHRNGLVVLGVITDETVPTEKSGQNKSTEKFALTLEDGLLGICSSDTRIKKQIYYSPGKLSKDKQIFCVYMTFRYKTDEELAQEQNPNLLAAETEQAQGHPEPDQSSPRFCSTDKALPPCPDCQKLEAQVEELFTIVARLQDEVSKLKKRFLIDVKVERPAVEHTPPASLSASKSTSTSSTLEDKKSRPVTVKQEKSGKHTCRK